MPSKPPIEDALVSVLAAIQMTSGPDVATNLAVAGPLLAAAAGAGAAVVLLPENFNFIGRRDADKREVAEAFGAGPTQDFLAATARRHGWPAAAARAPQVPHHASPARPTSSAALELADSGRAGGCARGWGRARGVGGMWQRAWVWGPGVVGLGRRPSAGQKFKLGH